MEKICTNCYYWWKGKCVNVSSSCYGIETSQDEGCSKFVEAWLQPVENVKTSTKETVNHPSHYNKGIEAIDIIESWELNFSLGNAIKYILRAPHKGNQLEDLKKARWYIEREIQNIEKLAISTK